MSQQSEKIDEIVEFPEDPSAFVRWLRHEIDNRFVEDPEACIEFTYAVTGYWIINDDQKYLTEH